MEFAQRLAALAGYPVASASPGRLPGPPSLNPGVDIDPVESATRARGDLAARVSGYETQLARTAEKYRATITAQTERLRIFEIGVLEQALDVLRFHADIDTAAALEGVEKLRDILRYRPDEN